MALLQAGKLLEAGPVGSRALMSLRIEKGYGSWGREYSPEYWPQEVGLAALIKMDKHFLNKDAYASLAERAPREQLVTFEINADDVATHGADATGGEPVCLPDGTPLGHVTSGAYGYSVEVILDFINAGPPGDFRPVH